MFHIIFQEVYIYIYIQWNRFIGLPVKRVSRFIAPFYLERNHGSTYVYKITPVNWAKYSVYWAMPVNSEPRVDTSKMSKRTDLSLAKKIALLDNELHAVSHRPVVSLCAVKGTSQRLLECLHVSCSARFQDESVLAQLCLGNRVRPRANPGQV